MRTGEDVLVEGEGLQHRQAAEGLRDGPAQVVVGQGQRGQRCQVSNRGGQAAGELVVGEVQDGQQVQAPQALRKAPCSSRNIISLGIVVLDSTYRAAHPPRRLLCAKFSASRADRSPMLPGIVPARLLASRFSTVSCLSLPMR